MYISSSIMDRCSSINHVTFTHRKVLVDQRTSALLVSYSLKLLKLMRSFHCEAMQIFVAVND